MHFALRSSLVASLLGVAALACSAAPPDAADGAALGSTSQASSIPTVTSLSTNQGSTAGGYAINVFGTNFVPGATGFTFGGYDSPLAFCLTSTQCQVNVPAWQEPDEDQVVHVQAWVGDQASATSTNDQFEYIGTGPRCTNNYGTCNSGQTDSVFVCDSAEGTITLYRQTQDSMGGYVWNRITNAGVSTNVNNTTVYELWTPPAGTTSATYKVCVDNPNDTSHSYETCGQPITISLPTTCTATCTPATCASLGACGNVGDGCGGTLSCGGCATGYTCSQNQCTKSTCTTKACQCAAAGGVWDGKYCE